MFYNIKSGGIIADNHKNLYFSYSFPKFNYEHFFIWCTPFGSSFADSNAVYLEGHSASGVSVGESDMSVTFHVWFVVSVAKRNTKEIHICKPFAPVRFDFPILLGLHTALDHFVPMFFEWKIQHFHSFSTIIGSPLSSQVRVGEL